MKPVIDPEKCTGCGTCVSACPAELFKLKNGKAVIVEGDCRGCKICEQICPTGAIEVEE